MPSTMASPDTSPRQEATVRVVLRLLTLALGAMHTLVAITQQSMNEDGINYLDVGDAVVAGEWSVAVNGVWSPLYGVIVSSVIRLFQPPMEAVFPTIHGVNLAIFLIAAIAFEFFWRELTRRVYQDGAAPSALLPRAVWLALGYSLFLWSSLALIHLWSVTPDMLVAATVYLTCGLLLRQARGARLRRSFLLGLVLGLGFLVKAPLLPLGAVALALSALMTPGSWRQRARQWGLSMFALLIGAAAWLIPLSVRSGHLTMGDVGPFTYLKHVLEMPYPDFQARAATLPGAPTHPPRRIFDDPPVYEFARPVGGTYPLGYDPAYWTEGIAVRLDLVQQTRAVISNLMFYFTLFVRKQGGFLAVVLLLGMLGSFGRVRKKTLEPEQALVLWALTALGMYALIHVMPRYVAPFVVLFWAGTLACLRMPAHPYGPALARAGGLLLVTFVWINLAAFHLEGLGGLVGFRPSPEAQAAAPRFSTETRAAHVDIARALRERGIEEGQPVGFIGYSFSAYWARLAGVRIVAEIRPESVDRFWTADSQRQTEVLNAFSQAGVTAVVSPPVRSEAPAGWTPLADTGYLLRRLP